MTPGSWRLLGNALLTGTIILLIVLILGMSGVIPRVPGTRELIILSMVLSVVARGARRRGRAPSEPTSGV